MKISFFEKDRKHNIVLKYIAGLWIIAVIYVWLIIGIVFEKWKLPNNRIVFSVVKNSANKIVPFLYRTYSGKYK